MRQRTYTPDYAPLLKHANRLWITLLVLGGAFDFLFWKKSLGINVPIFLLLCLLGGAIFLLKSGQPPARRSLWLLAPLVFFAALTCIRQEPLTHFLAYLFTLFLLALLTVSYRSEWLQYGLSDYFARFYYLFTTSLLTTPLQFFRWERKENARSGTPPTWNKVIKPILRGTLLAFPLLALLTCLLASADLVFEKRVLGLLGNFDSDIPGRLALILICVYLLAVAFIHAAIHSNAPRRPSSGENAPGKSGIGFTEAAIILSGVTLLYLAFVIVQFRYFFGGNANIGVTGYTYSQYARRGFNELLAVAFVSLLLIFGLNSITRRQNALQARIYSALGVTMMALVGVILVSAYQRLMLATEWHGYSRIRIYPRIFMIWMGILFVAVIVLEVLHRQQHFTLATVLALLGFAVSLSLFNVDASIVRHNVLRPAQGQHFNVNHLSSLSPDAVPTLAEEFQNPTLSKTTRQGIGAALVCYLYQFDLVENGARAWQSFNLSYWQANKALDQVEPQLQKYVIIGEYPKSVRTPDGELYECAE